MAPPQQPLCSLEQKDLGLGAGVGGKQEEKLFACSSPCKGAQTHMFYQTLEAEVSGSAV